MPESVLLEGDDDSYQMESGIATAVVTPGRLVDVTGFDTTGASDEPQISEYDTDGSNIVARFAMELSKVGKTIDDDYASDDYAEFRVFEAGEEAYGFVFDGSNAAAAGTDLSANANLAVGDYVTTYSGGGDTGCVRKWVSGTDTEGAKIAQVKEAVDNSAGSSPARVRLEVV